MQFGRPRAASVQATSRTRSHGGSFPVQKHHAPQRAPGRRALQAVRQAGARKHGGNLAETGAVSFMFDHVGVVEFESKVASADAMLDAAIEAGAEDVTSGEN